MANQNSDIYLQTLLHQKSKGRRAFTEPANPDDDTGETELDQRQSLLKAAVRKDQSGDNLAALGLNAAAGFALGAAGMPLEDAQRDERLSSAEAKKAETELYNRKTAWLQGR